MPEGQEKGHQKLFDGGPENVFCRWGGVLKLCCWSWITKNEKKCGIRCKKN